MTFKHFKLGTCVLEFGSESFIILCLSKRVITCRTIYFSSFIILLLLNFTVKLLAIMIYKYFLNTK
jgi:hypothetical protein